MQWFHSSFIQGFHFCLSQEPAEPEVDHEEWQHMRTDGGSSVPLDGPPMENWWELPGQWRLVSCEPMGKLIEGYHDFAQIWAVEKIATKSRPMKYCLNANCSFFMNGSESSPKSWAKWCNICPLYLSYFIIICHLIVIVITNYPIYQWIVMDYPHHVI